MNYQSLAEMFLAQAQRYGDRILYRFSQGGAWQAYTWRESLQLVRDIGLGLVSLGVRTGDRVAIFSANRVEWSLIDWADICIGALTVPIYSCSTASQVARILEHSGSKILFVESAERLQRMRLLDSTLRELELVIVIEPPKEPLPRPLDSLRVISLEALRARGQDVGPEVFERSAYSLRPADELTIIYTSGTTGEPKGVLTTHGHYLYMLEAVDAALPSSDRDVNLQFLPLAHSFGRLEHFVVVAKGYTCGFARSVETVATDLQVVRPTLLFSVPRVYENAYARIRSRAAGAGAPQRLLFRWGIAVGKRAGRYQREGRKASWGLRVLRSLAHRLVFSRVRSAFGGRLRLAISGGAPLAAEIGEFFHALGILILEGYGLTESSTVSHVNRFERYKFGTVGPALPGVECRIAPDGEVLLRGPNIFKGYFRDPEGTLQAKDAEGWFRTGDIGEIDGDGFLCITDRKKDLIVTSGGKKVAPQMIENLLKTDPLIHQAMVTGDRQKHLVALITLNQEQVRQWAKGAGLESLSPEEMASHPRVVALVKERIREKNKELAPFEAVRGFHILPREFTLENEELTPTLKLRRQVVMERYKAAIEEMSRKSRSGL